MQFSTEAVRDLARLLNETGLHEIALQTAGENDAPVRIVVRGAVAPPSFQIPNAPISLASAPENATLTTLAEILSEDTAQSVEETVRPLVAVTASAVGLFRPAAPPLQIGDTVRSGQVVGTVESLKIPTDVTAPAAGSVMEILAEDGQGVEYGQPLLMIEVEE